MKIVQVLPELNQGGVERGTVELSRELVRRGHGSIVISAGGRLAEQINRDGGRHITLDVCGKNPLTAPVRIYRLKSILQELAPDIVHARSRVPAWLCVLALRGLEIPFVTTVHGFNSVNAYSKVMTRGDRVIYGSAAIKDYILKHYKLDIAILRYVPRGVDTTYFDPKQIDKTFIDDFITQHNIADRYVISIIGRITEWKGHTCFIKAVAELYRKNKNIVGLIVGRTAENKDSYYKELLDLIESLGCPEAFRFAGPQPNVREIYALSHLIVSAASTKPETFGRIAAEALAMNTPVVASAHGGSLDIIKDETVGFLFRPGDEADLAEKIEKAMTFQLGHMRNHILQHFSLDVMVEKELDVYNELTQA